MRLFKPFWILERTHNEKVLGRVAATRFLARRYVR